MHQLEEKRENEVIIKGEERSNRHLLRKEKRGVVP
jgi:hypothetical protein